MIRRKKTGRGGFESPIVRKGFNPQPEPPGSESSIGFESPLVRKGFNPQPEPPGKSMKGLFRRWRRS